MTKKAIFDIHIEANGPMVRLKGENSEVLMVPFKGRVKSDLFIRRLPAERILELLPDPFLLSESIIQAA